MNNNIIIKSGIIRSNEEWNGNILISDDLLIPVGVRIFIKPNTKIKFLQKSKNKLFNKNLKLNYLIEKYNLDREQYKDKISVIVYGTIICEGSKENLTDIGNCSWNGLIYVADRGKIKLSYTRIRYSFGIISDVRAKVSILDNCIIEQCCLGVTSFSGISIKNCRFNYNEIGIICHKKSLLYNNELIDNFSVGILFLIKNNKVYLSYGKFLFNNIGIKIIESADVVFLNTKNSDILLQHNNIGVYLSQSININILVFKMIMYDNLINIYLNRLAANINLNNLQVFKGKGILSYCFGEIYINNSCFFDLDYVLELYNYTQVYLDSIKINSSIITFYLNNICSLSLENSTLDKSYLILFSLGKTYFYNNNNKFLNSNYGFVLQEQTVLNMLNSTVDNVEIVFGAVIYSSAYIYNNNIKKSRILSFIIGNSSLFFNKNLIESFTHSFVVKNRGKLLINDCSCKNKQNIFIVAKHYSEISINNSSITSLLGFVVRNNTKLKITKSNLVMQENFIAGFHKTSILVDNCKIKNKNKICVFATDNSDVKIINSYIKAKNGIHAKCNANVDICKSSMFVANSFIDTKNNVKVTLFDNKLKILNCKIKMEDDSILYLDNRIFSKNIFINSDKNNILFIGKEIVALNNIKISYKRNKNIKLENLILKAKNVDIIDENAQKMEILNCCIDSCISCYNKELVIIEKTKISSVVVNGEINTLVLNDVVLDDCNIKGNANIEKSCITGCIEAADGKNINIKNSKIYGCVAVKNDGLLEIENCEVKAKYMEVGAFGELNLKNTELNIEKNIKVLGKTSIFDSIINSKHTGIEKEHLENFICCNTKIYSFDNCLSISGKSNSFFTNVYLNSKTNYSVISNNNAELFFNNLTLVSSKGFLCNYGTKCKINNLSADIFYNLINIRNTDFSIENLILHCKIPKSLFLIGAVSNITVNNANVYLCDNFIFKQYLKEEDFIIYLRDFSNLTFNRLSLKTDDINKMCFLRADDKTNFVLKNVSVIGIYKFIYMGILSCGVISDSIISCNIYNFYLHQGTMLSIINTKLSNGSGSKFLIEDCGIVKLEKVSVLFGQLLTMNKFSEFYSSFSSFDNISNAGKIKGYSIINDSNSKWKFNDLIQQSAFYLQNNTKLFFNLSDISISGLFAYCIHQSIINIEHSTIKSVEDNKLLLLKNKSKATIINSNIESYSLASLQNYAQVFIQKSTINVRKFIVNLMGNSRAFIQNTFFKQINNIDKNSAFSILHNSKINITDSILSQFYIGIKYENKQNINIEKTKIDCKNKIVFTNEKRYLTAISPINKSFLYRAQLLVLATNKIIILKEIYNSIYFISILIYILCMCRKKVKSVYLRRGMLNNWIAGSSDIDYLTVLDNSNLNIEFYDIYNIKNRYLKIKKIFPFYGENIILNQEELNFYLKYGGIRSKLLKNSKCLYGKKQNFTVKEAINLKHKTDILKEILNSYILLSNNYFYNIDIVSDICFAKASVDILKYIDYLYNLNNLEISRTDYLKKNLSDDVHKNLYAVLQERTKLTQTDRNNIFNYVFNKLNEISIDFNKEIIAGNKVKKLMIYKRESINLYTELISYQENIKVIILDDPGLSYIVINNKDTDYSNIMLAIYKKAKENYCFYNTPILFFTENIFQAMLFSNFKNNPFECYNIRNMEESNFTRKIYLSCDYVFYSHINNVLFKELVISALSEMSIHINEINILQSFDNIKQHLYYLFIQMLQFYLFFKNDKMKSEYTDNNIVKEFKDNNKNKSKDIEKILFCFEEDCKLKDIEKTAKIIIFIKNLKSELIKLYDK